MKSPHQGPGLEIPHEGHAVNPKRGLGEQIMQRPTKQQHPSDQREICVSVSLLGMAIPATLLHKTGKKQPQWQNSVPFFKIRINISLHMQRKFLEGHIL